jgi:cytochrome c oxidase subunit IV
MSSESRREARVPVPPVASYLIVWGALLALLAFTVGSSFVPAGEWNLVVNLAIAGGKAALVAIFFMHLRTGTALLRLVAAAGVIWLGIMLTLTLADVLTRGG